jgi:prevent-host-death family protein
MYIDYALFSKRIFPMEKMLGVTKAREVFGELVEQVQYQRDVYIINRNGKPAAAIVPVDVYERWKNERQAFFDLIRQSQTATNLAAEEAETLASEAIVAARKGQMLE